MILHYPNKRTELEIYTSISDCEFILQNQSKSENKLIEGENLRVLKKLITEYHLTNQIDLIYIDPPFSTQNTFRIDNQRASTISSSKNANIAYTDHLVGAEFIEYLRERLILLKKLLSDKGSIYLHIDYKIGHYVKLIMDEVFGIENFRNDITRIKCNPKNFARKGYGNIKDMILFYSKSENMIWNEPKIAYTQEDKFKLFPKKDSKGRNYTTIPLHAPGETQNGKTALAFKGILPPIGRHWRTNIETLELWDKQGLIEWSENGNPRKIIYFEEQEGKRIQDIWDYKDPQYPTYPTEKNEEILNLILQTSSNENSWVLDCFCGSGTSLKAAHLNQRKWIGIDKSSQAIKATSNKLNAINGSLFLQAPDYQLIKTQQI